MTNADLLELAELIERAQMIDSPTKENLLQQLEKNGLTPALQTLIIDAFNIEAAEIGRMIVRQKNMRTNFVDRMAAKQQQAEPVIKRLSQELDQSIAGTEQEFLHLCDSEEKSAYRTIEVGAQHGDQNAIDSLRAFLGGTGK